MAVRPHNFVSFLGQSQVIDYLKIAVKSAIARKAVFGHAILYGPAGVGKTTLGAGVLPSELGCGVCALNCAAIEKPEDLTRKLVTMRKGDILFLDEVHALIPGAREHLLTVMEDSTLTVVADKQQPMVVELPLFTIVAATTRVGNLDAPFRSRFKHSLRLDTYTLEEMQQVLRWVVSSLGEGPLADPACLLLAEAAQGVARNAVTLVEACVDTLYGEDIQVKEITLEVATRTLARLGYAGGLSPVEIRYLQALADHGGKLGLVTLAALLDESQHTIQEVYEPHLLREGFIQKLANGRGITTKGQERLTYV